ncbi:MAG: (2Fe-2S) ferredoxin domain-containing protein [Rhodospirillales bacterium]
MSDPPTTLIVCVNRRFQSDKGSCAEKGSEALADTLAAGIETRRLNIALERIRCLGQCLHGPSMRLAPGGKFYLGVTPEDIPAILDEIESLCGRRAAEKKPASARFWPGS